MILNQKLSDCSLSLEEKPGHMSGCLLKWIDTDVVGCYRQCGTGFGDDSVGLSALKGLFVAYRKEPWRAGFIEKLAASGGSAS